MSLTRHTYKNLTWIDLSSPTREEVETLVEKYNVNPAVAEELLTSTRKPHIDLYEGLIYIVLHFPAIAHTHQKGSLQEVDFILTKDVLITTRYDGIDAIQKFERVFEANEITERSPIGEHAGFLFYFLIKKLYRSLEHELEAIASRLEGIESRIFSGKEKEMVTQLSLSGRDIADFKKALGYHDEILDSLQVAGKILFGDAFSFYLGRITGEYKRVQHQLSGEQAFFNELRETNNSLLTTKQNEVMKTFTIIAFVTFPLTLIAGIFGMNTMATPIIGHARDFWIVLGIMGSLTLLMFGYFKHKRWL